MNDRIREALPWPLFTVDFEASSLAPGSFPIEVGVCRWSSPDDPIEGWSTLIKPAPLWKAAGSWTTEAETIHRIRREELEEGLSPAETLSILNWIVGPYAAFCDGGVWDFGWARRLVLAAKFMNSFRLGDFDMLVNRCDHEGSARVTRWLDATPARHRARDDAERLIQALAHGFQLELPTETLDIRMDPTSETIAWRSQLEPDSTSVGTPIEREPARATRLWKPIITTHASGGSSRGLGSYPRG